MLPLFSLIMNVHFLIPSFTITTQTLHLTKELAIPIGLPTKEAKSKIETYLKRINFRAFF